MKVTWFTTLVALLMAGCGGDDGPRTDKEGTEGTFGYFTRAIEVSGKFQKGATVVLSVSGEVSIIESVGSDANQSAESAQGIGRTAQAEEVLSPGHQVRTGPSSEALLLFSNGSTVTVGPGTKVRIAGFVQEDFNGSDQKVSALTAEVSPSRLKLDLEVGELILGVKKLKKESAFFISTSMGIAGVRGTQFKVVASDDRTSISVLSGLVDFQSLGKQFRSIPKGTMLEASDDGLEGRPIHALDKTRIESSQLAVDKKIGDFSLAVLSEAFDGINSKQSQVILLLPLPRSKEFSLPIGTETTEKKPTKNWVSLLSLKPASINADVGQQYYATSARHSANSNRLLKRSATAKLELKKAKHWIFMHPTQSTGSASSTYVFAKPITQFSVTLRVLQKRGDAIFSIYNDKKLVKKVPLKGDAPKDILLTLGSCRKLRLGVNKGAGFNSSWAIWMNPKVK